MLFAMHHRSPIYLFQVIVDGILGESTFRRSTLGPALGVFCDFLIAVTAAAVFYAVSRIWVGSSGLGLGDKRVLDLGQSPCLPVLRERLSSVFRPPSSHRLLDR